MAVVVPRILVTNRALAAASTLTASSAQAAAPVSYLRDQLRTKTWRTAFNVWVVVAGVNDKIDFDVAGGYTATILPGTYTAPTYAAAVAAALEAALPAPDWTCTYSGTTHKFTITKSGAATLQLLWATGANTAIGAHRDLGFAVADSGLGGTHTGDYAVYQSRHWLKLDCGSALAAQAAVALDHNLGANGTITLQGNATDAWSTPSVSQAFSPNADGDLAVAWLAAQQTLRYWRLVIDDTRNPEGFSEMGVVYVGPFVQPTVAYAVGWTKSSEPLSEISVTPSGAHWVNSRPQRPTWSPMGWAEVPEATRAALMGAFDLVPVGTNFFFAFDASGSPTKVEYVWLRGSARETLADSNYYDVSVPELVGALG